MTGPASGGARGAGGASGGRVPGPSPLRLGASAILFRLRAGEDVRSAPIGELGGRLAGLEILLIRRGRPPLPGLWSFPGGKLAAGESEVEAVVREVREETGLSARVAGFLCHHEVMPLGAGQPRYRIAVFYGGAAGGEPIAASDAAEARFVELSRLADYRLTDGAAELALAAARLFADKGDDALPP